MNECVCILLGVRVLRGEDMNEAVDSSVDCEASIPSVGPDDRLEDRLGEVVSDDKRRRVGWRWRPCHLIAALECNRERLPVVDDAVLIDDD